MDVDIQDVTPESLFRPSKRRKFYRKRADSDGEGTAAQTTLIHDPPPAFPSPPVADPSRELASQDEEDRETQIPIAEILRLRKAAKYRKGGIEFTNSSRPLPSGTASSQPAGALVERDRNAEEVQEVVNRFAPQTGQVADVNKHM